jgi:hypothetical protein
MVSLQTLVPLPGDRVLLLICSSPVLPLAEDLLELFEGVQQFVDGDLLGLKLPPGTRVNVQWLLDHGYLGVRP